MSLLITEDFCKCHVSVEWDFPSCCAQSSTLTPILRIGRPSRIIHDMVKSICRDPSVWFSSFLSSCCSLPHYSVWFFSSRGCSDPLQQLEAGGGKDLLCRHTVLEILYSTHRYRGNSFIYLKINEPAENELNYRMEVSQLLIMANTLFK